MEFLYLPFNVFVFFPPLVFLVALGFLFLFLHILKRHKTLNYILLITVICWVIYGLWEIKMHYWSETVTAPIRVDLIFIVPLLYAISVAGLISFYHLSKN